MSVFDTSNIWGGGGRGGYLVDNLNDGSFSCGVHKNTDSQTHEIIPSPGQMLARFQHGHFMCDVGPLHRPDIPPLLTYLHFHGLKKNIFEQASPFE